MDLSLSDAARLLGKSKRQVRYLIQTKKLKANKVDHRWKISCNDLPLTTRQAQELEIKRENALQIAEEILRGKADGRRYYSVLDLRAFEAGRKNYLELIEQYFDFANFKLSTPIYSIWM